MNEAWKRKVDLIMTVAATTQAYQLAERQRKVQGVEQPPRSRNAEKRFSAADNVSKESKRKGSSKDTQFSK